MPASLRRFAGRRRWRPAHDALRNLSERSISPAGGSKRVPGTLGGDSHGNQPQLGANLGIGMLKQFDLTLDLGRDRIILKPLASPPGFDRDRAGVRASPDGTALRVLFVSPQGPAAKAGLKAGDKIVAINGQPIGKDFFATPAGRWNLASAGTPVTLTLEGGRTVHFALADFY